MRSEYVFDFQCRDFVAAGLDDVDTVSAQNAIDVPGLDRDVTGAEPAVLKGTLCLLRTIPILLKHSRSADLNFPGLVRGRGFTVFVSTADLDSRQRSPYVSRYPFSVQWIG